MIFAVVLQWFRSGQVPRSFYTAALKAAEGGGKIGMKGKIAYKINVLALTLGMGSEALLSVCIDV